MAVPFWIPNLDQDPVRKKALEDRWNDKLTQAQLKNPWQQVIFDGKQIVPGFCRMKKIVSKLKVQKHKPAGSDKGKITVRGLENPVFELDVELYTLSQFNAWVQFVKIFDMFGDPNSRDRHRIEHPLCRLCGVTLVMCIGVEYEAPEAGGPLKCKLHLGACANEKPGTAVTPSNNPPAGGSPVATIPLDPQPSPSQSLQQYISPPPAAR